jgi:hypothetical protein
MCQIDKNWCCEFSLASRSSTGSFDSGALAGLANSGFTKEDITETKGDTRGGCSKLEVAVTLFGLSNGIAACWGHYHIYTECI